MPKSPEGPAATLADEIRAGLHIRAICLECQHTSALSSEELAHRLGLISRCAGLSAGYGATSGVGHVWMAPGLQEFCHVWLGRLRSCVRPFDAVYYGPLALMGSAGRGLISLSGSGVP